ncbi:aldo/keto reductase [Halorussus halophilus]|uniref:aldo/keto reductase n=1 Tax=Halorussus halophilus TaxID=2650975 RepID=UPI0013014C71|nr:aldo/keto reductase [Halorussus halophilus]
MVENQSDTFEVGGELTVNRLGYGAMRLTGEDIIGPPDDEAVAHDVLRRAVELGVDFIDTADSYGPGVSERLIGEALDPEEAVVATKAGLLRNASGDWIPHGGSDYVRNQVLCSIDRLGVESIDLYQLHTPDVDAPFEDVLQTFGELQDDGLVDHVGVSNVSVEQLDQARDVVDVATVQNNYNVGNREHEDVLEACEDAGIGFMAYFPIGGGELDKADVLEDVAANHDATVRQVALAWVLQHSPVTLPIPGTSSVEHLEENIAASAIELSSEEMKRLGERSD